MVRRRFGVRPYGSLANLGNYKGYLTGEGGFTAGMVKHFHPNLHAYMLDQLAKVKALP